MRRVAILIDGGFFLKRLPSVRPDVDRADPVQVDRSIGQLIWSHLEHLNKQHECASPYALLYRCFFYDASPYTNREHYPISKKPINYAKSKQAIFRFKLFELLRKRRSFAVRLGKVRKYRSWALSEKAQKELLTKKRSVDDLMDEDFAPGFRQKAVDMRIGIDIASLTLKKQADTIILVSADSDFVPATKLARREGVEVILEPLWQTVHSDLHEHIDGLRSGFGKHMDKDTEKTEASEAQ